MPHQLPGDTRRLLETYSDRLFRFVWFDIDSNPPQSNDILFVLVKKPGGAYAASDKGPLCHIVGRQL